MYFQGDSVMYLNAGEIDRRLRWPAGTALRLARRRRLPHVVLPDGSIRFEWAEVGPLVVRVPADPGCRVAPAPAC
jgi:hypothetical protein